MGYKIKGKCHLCGIGVIRERKANQYICTDCYANKVLRPITRYVRFLKTMDSHFGQDAVDKVLWTLTTPRRRMLRLHHIVDMLQYNYVHDRTASSGMKPSYIQ